MAGDHIGHDVNEHGARVSVHECGECGDRFTVCPPAKGDFGGCQSEECASYDPDRDVDQLFEIRRGAAARIVRRTIQ